MARVPIGIHDTRLGLRLPYETRERAEHAAATLGLSVSDLIRLLIERHTEPIAPTQAK